MLLAINVNNTNVKFAIYDGDTMMGQWRIAMKPTRTSDEYAVWLTQLMALKDLKPSNIDHSIVANVVPQTLFEIKSLCRTYFNCEPAVIGDKQVDLGIAVKIDQPQEAGADRLVNAVAGHKIYGGPLIIVDFGTATTFDVIDQDGNYIGGVIAPGINLSVEALYVAAAKLPRIAIERPKHVIGRNSVDAMKSGVYWGYVGLIEGLIKRIRSEHGRDHMKVIVTGGLAPLFVDATDIFDTIDVELTMKGLVEIHGNNLQNKGIE
jgi:type III pantothenate kinase